MKKLLTLVVLCLSVLIPSKGLRAQETTAAVQGTVTDPTGAVVVGAKVTVTGDKLASASAVTDSHGFYRLNALPPGVYTLSVTGGGMSATETNLKLLAGDLPTLNIGLKIGTAATVVDVSSSVAMVDVTQSKVETTISSEIIALMPKGRSFQSVITFAPGARQEPLQSLAPVNGTSTPNAAGNANIGGNGSRTNGFQIDGASDSENVYLSDGVNISNIQGGGIGFNVPFEFVQDVQVKSSSFEAEFGGALGGVINVIQQRGTSGWHGSLFTYYRSSALNANAQCAVNATCFLRSDPLNPQNSSARLGALAQYYIAKQDHYRYIDPGFTLGGPLWADKLFLFTSYAPSFQRTRRDALSTFASNAGPHTYYNSSDQHFGFVRLDAAPTSKLRLFASWQYAYLRIVGQLPTPDSKIAGQLNSNSSSNPAVFREDSGFVNPGAIYSTGADYTLTSRTLVSARYGYTFSNVHSLGAGSGLQYLYNGSATSGTKGLDGSTLPAAYQQPSTFSNISANQPQSYNTYTRKQFGVDLSHIQTGLFGTHAFKGGYSFVQLANSVKILYDYANVTLYYGQNYSVGTSPTACDAIKAANAAAYGATNPTGVKGCTGNYGYFIVHDGTDVLGKDSSNSHGLYVQDDWTVGRTGLTINAGIRFDKEALPPYSKGDPSISFGWGSKIAPRIGGAYDLLHNGKLKLFASYGQFYDILKFSLPQGSFGGNYWHDCVYTIDNPNYNLILPTAPVGPDGFRHSCPVSGLAPGVPANPATDVTAAGGANGRFIENIDYRAVNNSSDDPGVDPNIKPMKQHETVAGAEWAMTPSLTFSTRYSRKRLDNTIEDIGLNDTYGYYIGNPGSAYADLLHRAVPNVYRNATINIGQSPTIAAAYLNPSGICSQCPAQPKAIREYDGLDFRVDKRCSRYFLTAFYTYCRLRGNYPGLTSTFINDGTGGRHNPNNNRSFDIPTMQFTAAGKPFGGPLPTDRPHSVSFFGATNYKWFGGETKLGISQQIASGTPISTCVSLGGSTTSACQFVEDQGSFVNFSRCACPGPTNGDLVSSGVTHNKRTPVYSETGANLNHYVHASKEHEKRKIGAEITVSQLLNLHAVVAVV